LLDHSGDIIYGTYEFVERLSELTEIRRIWFTNGEITVDRDAAKVFGLCESKGYGVTFVTNAFVYREEIGRMLGSGEKYMINTSLDCGTRESFKRIKGVDRFEKVVANLKKYASSGGRIYLKWIFLEGINDNEADMDGFSEICAEIHPYIVGVAADFLKRDEQMPDALFEKFKYLLEKLESSGQNIELNYYTMYPNDAKRIQNCVKCLC
jgi:pyruvate-formate lyase-activating enzyme